MICQIYAKNSIKLIFSKITKNKKEKTVKIFYSISVIFLQKVQLSFTYVRKLAGVTPYASLKSL